MIELDIYSEMCTMADSLLPEMTERRQDFHKYAETGWFEIRTTSIIADRLSKLGYDPIVGERVCRKESRMGLPSDEELDKQYERALSQGAIEPWADMAKGGFTGVIAELDCGEGPVIALRFDIDALGVYEDERETHRAVRECFHSVNDGMMHACGHDGHATIGLAVASVLMKFKDRFHGKIRLIFQPCEEGVRGAKSIVDNGWLSGVDYVIGNHMADYGDNPDCDIFLTTGSTLATTKLDAFFSGLASHAGASPEKGKNAMLAACSAVMNLQAIPRFSGTETRINVGTLQAGSGRNVIPDRAKLELEVRGSTTEANDYMREYAERIIRSSAEMHDCGCDIKMMGAAPCLISDLSMIQRCKSVCEEKLNLKVAPVSDRAGGSEDFAYMVLEVQKHGGAGLFFNTLTDTVGPNHSTVFDIQEKSFPAAVKTFCGLVFDIMGI